MAGLKATYSARFVSMSVSMSLLSGCAGLWSSFPPPVIPASPAPGDWPDVGAAVIEDVATLEYRMAKAGEDQPAKVVAVLEHRRRLKVLTEAGLAEATVELPVDRLSSITSVRARSVARNGRIVELNPATVRRLPRTDTRQQAPGIGLITFTVPGAEVGGLIDIRTTRIYATPAVVEPWLFGGRLPVVRAELSVIADPGIKLDYRYGHGETIDSAPPMRRKMADGRDRFVFVEQNLPPFFSEPRMPHLSRVAPWVATVVTQASSGGKEIGVRTWHDVAKMVRALFRKVEGKPLTGSPEARFRRLRNRLNSLNLDGLGLLPPTAAAELNEGAPACNRDAAALLTRALVDSGFDVYPALLTSATGPVVDESFPSFYPFVRAVVAIDVREDVRADPSCVNEPKKRSLLCHVPTDSYAFLDPTCKGCRYGELRTELSGGRALVLVPGKPRWVDVPALPAEHNRQITRFDLTIDNRGQMNGKISAELVGGKARLFRNGLAALGLAYDKRAAYAKQQLLGARAKPSLDKVTIAQRKEVDMPLRIVADYRMRATKIEAERFRIRPADLVGPAMPGRWRTTRRYPILLDAPAWMETVATIELPVGYTAEELPAVQRTTPFAEYVSGFERRGRTLSFSRRLVLRQQLVTVEQWAEFRELLDEIEAVEKSGVVVWRSGD